MAGDDEYSSVTGQADAKNRLEYSLRKTITAQKTAKGVKVSAATSIVINKVVVPGFDHYVRLSELKTIIEQAFLKCKKEEIPR